MVGYMLDCSFTEVVARVAGLGEAYYCNVLLQDIDYALARECQGLKAEKSGVGRAWILYE